MSGSSTAPRSLVLRLAGPLQSWGSRSQFNRRETDRQPTKSGVLGLLAAAEGRRREDPIADLLRLQLGVRVDQEGSLLRDYHTVSDLRGRPLLSASVTPKGSQKPTSPPKYTAVTHRFYLEDATFIAVLGGEPTLLEGLAQAVERPSFPLALGRRSCVPTQPLLLRPPEDGSPLWAGSVEEVLTSVPWQASSPQRRRISAQQGAPPTVRLAVTFDHAGGKEAAVDVPRSFAHRQRDFVVRRVQHGWVDIPTGFEEPGAPAGAKRGHDPFALLGW